MPLYNTFPATSLPRCSFCPTRRYRFCLDAAYACRSHWLGLMYPYVHLHACGRDLPFVYHVGLRILHVFTFYTRLPGYYPVRLVGCAYGSTYCLRYARFSSARRSGYTLSLP